MTRNLSVIKENGIILELNFAGTSRLYDANWENHYRFRCLKCGRVPDRDEPVNYALDEKVGSKNGYTISSQR